MFIPVALLQDSGPSGPQAAIIIVVVLVVVAVVWGIGFAWGRSKRDKARQCPKCGRRLKQPADAACCAYCGAKL